MRIMAIDPGDRWCGYARLYLQEHEFHAETGVVDREALSFVDTVKALVPTLAKAVVLTEQYRARPQGFNAFREMSTPMLIGGIRFFAEHRALRWTEVPAGDAQLLENMPLGVYIKTWAKMWPEPGRREWDHARSAWRVLAQYMLTTPATVKMLKQLYTTNTPVLEKSTTLAPLHDGLAAPSVRWITR